MVRTRIFHPETIELSSSKSVLVQVDVYNLYVGILNCPSLLDTAQRIQYQAQLFTAGIEVSPEITQTFTDNISYDKDFAAMGHNSHAEWTWVLYPNEPGMYTVHIRIFATAEGCEILDLGQDFELQVVNMFGLSAEQIKYVGFISGFFGSALTLPGVLAILAKFKEERAKKQHRGEVTHATLIISASGKEKDIETTHKNKRT